MGRLVQVGAVMMVFYVEYMIIIVNQQRGRTGLERKVGKKGAIGFVSTYYNQPE